MKRIENIASEILKQEGFGDWKIDWWLSPPSECINDFKTIIISDTYKNEPLCYQFEILIHEISHCYFLDHDFSFYDKMGELLQKYAYFMLPKTRN